MPTRRSISPRAATERRTHAISAAKSNSQSRASKAEDLNSTRGRILISAERLFAQRGFSSVTMPMIAHESGITAGAIYKHFDSKADLFFEVVRRAVQATSVVTVGRGPSRGNVLASILASYSSLIVTFIRKLIVEV